MHLKFANAHQYVNFSIPPGYSQFVLHCERITIARFDFDHILSVQSMQGNPIPYHCYST